MRKIRFPLGLRPRPRWEILQRSPDLLAVFKGSEREEGEGRKEGKRRGREEEGREGRGQAPKYLGPEPPLAASP